MARAVARPSVGERSNTLFIAGAVGLALIAAIFAFAALRTARDGGSSGPISGPEVVIATQRIEAGMLIEDGMLDVVRVSDSSAVEGALLELEAVAGKVARFPVEKGGQFTTGALGTPGESSGSLLGDVVAPGRRAVPVEVSEEKIFGGLLAPGDHVDVVAVISRSQDGVETQSAIAIVQNAEVLAVADASLAPIARLDSDGNPIVTDESEGAIAEQPDDIEAQPEARSVTLQVMPEDALSIALAQEEGSVWLILRGTGDEETLPIEDQTLN
jgi:pilus assembly protein CpaB